MPTIDADAHVIETPRTWEYMTDEERDLTPIVVQRRSGGEMTGLEGNAIQEYWVVGGRLMNKQANVSADTAPDAREMRDIEARLKHMDELDIDVQVLFPTLFLQPVAEPRTRGSNTRFAAATTAGSPTSGKRRRTGCAGSSPRRSIRWTGWRTSCASARSTARSASWCAASSASACCPTPISSRFTRWRKSSTSRSARIPGRAASS